MTSTPNFQEKAVKVLITGYRGFIGSHLKELLPEANGIDLKDGNDILIFQHFDQYDYIFHLAAKRGVAEGETDPKNYIMTNCWGSLRVFNRAKPTCKIINISSSSSEEAKSVYGATKKFVELIARKFPNVITVRPYNVFGEGQPLESGAVVPQFINSLLTREVPVIYGSGEQKRDFTYVGDLVEYLKWLMFECKDLEGEKDSNDIIHAGYGSSISVLELLESIYGYLPERLHKDSRGFEIIDSQSPMGIPIVYGRQDGLRRTIEWWLSKK